MSALEPLLDGSYVHGIVSMDPPTVRCDGCGATHSEPSIALAVIVSRIYFSPRRYTLPETHPEHDRRRLCAVCRSTEWPEER